MRLSERLKRFFAGRSPFRDAATILALVALCYAAVWSAGHPYGPFGRDFTLYQRHVETVLAGGPMYPRYETTGAYLATDGVILYPPIAILAFAPTLLMPAVLWWAIPLTILVAQVIRWRPSQLGVAAVLFCVAWAGTPELIWAGNPTMWLAAALAIGVERWPAATTLVFLKPSLLPFALVGIRSRAWWIAAGTLAVLSLLLLPATLDWVTAVRNLNPEGRAGLGYSLVDLPYMAIPLVAWLTRSRVRAESGRRRDGGEAVADQPTGS